MATLNTTLFPLFIKTEEPTDTENNITLFMHGCTTGRSGLFGTCDLFIYGSSLINTSINLFLQNYGPESGNSYLNLYTRGENHYLNSSIPLIINNSGVDNQLTLYIRGSGTTAGAFPLSSNMNLFLQRNEAGAITLFLQGQGESGNNNITLFTKGAFIVSSGLDLCIPNVIGTFNNSMQLYSHGF